MKPLEKGNLNVAEGRDSTFAIRLFSTFAIAVALMAVSVSGFSQNNQYNNGDQQYLADQPQGRVKQSIAPMVAQYDEDIRNNILTATQYPDVLEKLAHIRDNTGQAFRETIDGYPQKKQEWFYQVSRYPELMHSLATLPRRESREQIDGLVANTPNASPELKEAAWKLYNNHHGDLVAVDNLNEQAGRAFQDLISPLNYEAQDAFKALEEMPDVLSILNDHSDLTARLGEEFKNDPEGTRQDLASLHDKLQSENEQELANYQHDMSQDPQALEEYNDAKQQYAAASNGYSYPAPTGDKVVNYYNNPYSYWFGYPYWYGSAMWYPGAFGFGGGMYYGMGLYGYPSFGFSNWFFGGAYRYYPHLYRTYGNYYRNTLSSRRVIYARDGFNTAAARHFNPNMSSRSYGGAGMGRSNYLGRGQSYRSAPAQSNSRSYNGGNMRSYNGGGAVRSYNGGGAMRSYGGGGFSRGGGFSGGGFSRGGRR